MAKPRVLEVVSDVYLVSIGRGAFSTNVYLIRSESSWTLVDAGWYGSEKKILATAESVFGPGARPASMVLTHLHPDHSGATRRLVEHWGQPAYVHPDELPLAAGYQSAYAIPLDRWLVPLIRQLPQNTQTKITVGADLAAVVQAFDPHVGIPGLPDWTAIHTPGHTPGHLSLYRRDDGVLITGDAVVTVDLNSLLGLLTTRQGVFGPPRYSTWDGAAAQRSIAALAALEPRVLATGHGPGPPRWDGASAAGSGARTRACSCPMATGSVLGRGLQRSDPLPATASAVPAAAEATWSVHDQSRVRTEGRRGAGSSGPAFGKDPP